MHPRCGCFNMGYGGIHLSRSLVSNHQRSVTSMQTDPVCGMQVDPQQAAGQSEYQGKTYYFCAPGCKKRFDSNPAQYTAPGPAQTLAQLAPKPMESVAEYACPMHPAVRQLGPGFCPKCGMALEPVEVTGEEVNPELRDMTRRFFVSVALT